MVKNVKRFRKIRKIVKRRAKPLAPTFTLVKGLQHGFPDRYFCRQRCSMFFAVSSVATQRVAYKANNIMNVGPNINNGGFNANYPAGACSLYSSSESGTGDIPPYTSYRVWGSRMSYRYTTTGTASPNVRIVSYPHRIDAGNSGALSFQQIAEQPYAKVQQVAPVLNTSCRTVSQYMSSGKMFGVPKTLVYQSAFSTAGSVAPAYSWFWNIFLYGDAVNTFSGTLEVDIDFDIEYFDKAILLSTAP